MEPCLTIFKVYKAVLFYVYILIYVPPFLFALITVLFEFLYLIFITFTVFFTWQLNYDLLPLLDIEGFAVEMVDIYCKNLPLSKDLDIQESVHGEDLLSMACNILVQVMLCL